MESSNAAKQLSSRRELKTRGKAWAQQLALAVAKTNVTPNQVSVLSVVFALGGLVAYIAAHSTANSWLLIFAIAGIQLRLLCNLLDGMLAIEYKKKSAVGDLYNEIPDRIADAIIILGAGLYCQAHDFGMALAATNIFLATMTAYIRALGASLGLGHQFLGPMAKQHRMALLTIATAIDMIFNIDAVYVALWIMFVGLLITLVRRISSHARALKETK
ncbi:CDP-alcohol phosphatidyltransferase family protein [Bdellovibrio sp. NC01]|uniref:CDP-alcohol phosphatidyltransferase family protein n=1 Tax=Bdellovibrio sp. NC01 TaxID=2220073 RepID=UPI00115A8731|nr:CDP-alcohol phosphatidyltransferase family protein [Bdellovibrio sp. NC01]QDK39063.1 CDP-alcohol phosphatidyltransferase family protein [Bdellovibrio sp. NC01]